MSDVQDLLKKADELGRAIAGNEKVRAYLTARTAVQNDSDAQALLRDYQAQAVHVQQLQAQQQPIEVADKQKLAELEGKMAGNESLKGLMRTQADYIELMNKINQAMEKPLSDSPQVDKAE